MSSPDLAERVKTKKRKLNTGNAAENAEETDGKFIFWFIFLSINDFI